MDVNGRLINTKLTVQNKIRGNPWPLEYNLGQMRLRSRRRRQNATIHERGIPKPYKITNPKDELESMLSEVANVRICAIIRGIIKKDNEI